MLQEIRSRSRGFALLAESEKVKVLSTLKFTVVPGLPIYAYPAFVDALLRLVAFWVHRVDLAVTGDYHECNLVPGAPPCKLWNAIHNLNLQLL